MGGMIAQTIAARHPGATRSLVSIMSNTGALRSGQPGLRTYPVLLRPPARGREAFIERMVGVFELIGSPDIPRDIDEVRTLAGISYDRDHDPAGPGRQLAAIVAAGNRTEELSRITAPTLVVHGTADRLVSPSGGRATARAIPGARLLKVDGMGHDLPRALWPELIGEIVAHANASDAHPRRDPSPQAVPL